jgi:nucleoside-diphosphate-sugar epimerase
MYAGVIPIFVRELTKGREACIFGDGEQTRDFTYVANAVQANLKAASAPGPAGMVFNVGAGVRTSVNRLYELIAKILGVTKPSKHLPPREGDIRDSLADITAARTVLGYNPSVSLEAGLVPTVEWLKTQLK